MYVDETSTPSPTLWEEVAQFLCIEVGRIRNINPVIFFKCRQQIAHFLAVQRKEDLQSLAVGVEDFNLMMMTLMMTMFLELVGQFHLNLL